MAVDAPQKKTVRDDAEAENYTEVRVTRLNLRFLVILLAAVAVTAAGLYVVHGVQTQRNAKVLKERAEAALAKNDVSAAINYLTQYVGLQPRDIDAQIQLGNLLEDTAANGQQLQRVFKIYETVLTRDSDRRDVRRRQVDVAMQIGRYSDALTHIESLFQNAKSGTGERNAGEDKDTESGETDHRPSSRPDLLVLAGDCYRASGKPEEALSAYARALTLSPERIEAYTGLVAVLDSEFRQAPRRKTVKDRVSPEEKDTSSRGELGILKELTSKSGKQFEANLEQLLAAFPPDETTEIVPTTSAVEALLARMVDVGLPPEKALLTRARFRLSASEADDELPIEDEKKAAQQATAVIQRVDQNDNDVLERAEFATSPLVPALADGDNDGHLIDSELAAYYVLGDRQARYNAAREDLEAALELAPNDPEILLTAARLAVVEAENRRSRGDEHEPFVNAAREYAERGLKQQPPNLRFYTILADAERLTGDEAADQYAREQKHYRDALKAAPDILKQAKPREQAAIRAVAAEIRWALADLLIAQAQLQTPPDAALLKEARELTAELPTGGIRNPLVEFLNNRLALVERADQPDTWYRVALELQNIRHDLRSRRDLLRRVDLMLGQCYERLANPDARADVFRRALAEDPMWFQGRMQLAAAYVAQNRLDDALQTYQLYSGYPAVAAEVARLQIVQELRRPDSGQREKRWDAILAYLDGVEKKAGASAAELVQLPILRAELLVWKKQYDEARQVLETAREQFPDEPRVWTTLASLALARQDHTPPQRFQNAEQILRQAKDKFGDTVELRLAAANLAAAQPADQAQLSLQELESENKDFTPEDRTRLLEGLARVYERIGTDNEVHRIWTQLAKENPHEVQYLLRVAAGINDREKLQTLSEDIRKVEGPGGPNGNVIEASILIAEAEASKAAESDSPDLKTLAQLLARPRNLLRQAAQQRPLWAAVPQLQGRLEKLLKNDELAAEHFQKSISLGARSKLVIEQVVQHLYEQKRYDEADRLLADVASEDPGLMSGSLAHLQAEIALQQQDYSRALNIARGAAESESFQDKLWSARIQFVNYQKLSANERRSETGKNLLDDIDTLYREAIELAADKPAVWFAYVIHLARLGETERAQAVIREAQEKLPAEPKYLRPVTLARCYEVIGSREPAEQQYLKAVQTAPGDYRVQKEIARFYFRAGDLAKARPFLDRMTNPEATVPRDDVEWAERAKALLIAASGSYSDTVSALELLGGQSVQDLSLADLRARMAILSTRNTRRDRVALIEVLKELDRRKAISPVERFNLARYYAANGEWTKSKTEFEKTLQSVPDDTAVLSTFVLSWLQQGNLGEYDLAQVEDLIARLQRIEPNSIRTAMARAHLLSARGKGNDAAELLKGYIAKLTFASPEETFRDLVRQEQPEEAIAALAAAAAMRRDEGTRKVLARVQQLIKEGDREAAQAALNQYVAASDLAVRVQSELARTIAAILEDLDQVQAAEEIYREYVERAQQPEAALVLAGFLARQGRIDEALDICDSAWEHCDPLAVARTSAGVVRTGTPAEEHVARVEAALRRAIEASEPRVTAELMVRLADILDFQGRYRDAAVVYRQILERNSRHLVALNNLAWLLAYDGRQPEEALRLIDRAIDLAGPMGRLLDTRGVIKLKAGRSKDALADLQAAATEVREGATLFHLALAQVANGDIRAARRSLAEADEQGLSEGDLHALERSEAAALRRQLGGDNRRASR